MTNFQKSDFKFVECKIAKTDFSLSDNDSFLRSIFQNQGLGVLPQNERIWFQVWTQILCSQPWNHKWFQSKNPAAKNTERNTKTQNQKSGFATFLVLISHLSFLRFPKNSKVKTHRKKTSFTVFLVLNLKRIMPVLSDIQRVRAFIFCKRYFVP